MSPTIRIDKKIKATSVVTRQDATAQPAVVPEPQAPAPTVMGEHIGRPDQLSGRTYKIKVPTVDHALYITINDIILDEETDHAVRRPFEIFVNSKNMEQFQWVVALTRIMSAVFRKGGDVTFLVEEMKAIFDPRGGYFKPGGVYMPSVVAEMGHILERHLTGLGLMRGPEMSDAQRALLESKREQLARQQSAAPAQQAKTEAQPAPASAANDAQGQFPPQATLCSKCHTKALVLLDGCQTCLNCGYSKCG